ncbi:MAG: hypothetical protein IPJ23_18290 [Ignavibacteriales bacterium]|nr:hypothetical protein [Ignavibacteriales bacterium]
MKKIFFVLPLVLLIVGFTAERIINDKLKAYFSNLKLMKMRLNPMFFMLYLVHHFISPM